MEEQNNWGRAGMILSIVYVAFQWNLMCRIGDSILLQGRHGNLDMKSDIYRFEGRMLQQGLVQW
jgi:hypothetical protein